MKEKERKRRERGRGKLEKKMRNDSYENIKALNSSCPCGFFIPSLLSAFLQFCDPD